MIESCPLIKQKQKNKRRFKMTQEVREYLEKWLKEKIEDDEEKFEDKKEIPRILFFITAYKRLKNQSKRTFPEEIKERMGMAIDSSLLDLFCERFKFQKENIELDLDPEELFMAIKKSLRRSKK